MAKAIFCSKVGRGRAEGGTSMRMVEGAGEGELGVLLGALLNSMSISLSDAITVEVAVADGEPVGTGVGDGSPGRAKPPPPCVRIRLT
jgi:hypothetical protein